MRGNKESSQGQGRSEALKELGCGLLTVLLVTLPLSAFSLATRGPVFFLKAVVIAFLLLLVFLLARRLRGYLRRLFRRLS